MKDYSQRVIDFECAKPYLKDLEHQICIAAFYTFIFLYLTQQNSRIHILMYTLNGNLNEIQKEYYVKSPKYYQSF